MVTVFALLAMVWSAMQDPASEPRAAETTAVTVQFGVFVDHSAGSRGAFTERRFVALIDGADRVAMDLGLESEIEAAVGDWHAAIDAAADDRAAGVRLRRLIIDPIRKAAPTATTLQALVDGALHSVPVDALPEDDGTRVGDSLRVILDPAFARLADDRLAITGEPRFLVVAPNPDAHAEIDAIANEFHAAFDADTVRITGRDATAPTVVSALPRARYIHFATHGWFAPEPNGSTDQTLIRSLSPMLLCGLSLAGENGSLTAEELLTLDLSNCALVVFAGSDTNVGIRSAGQGICSIAAAAHAAGARAVISSLWKVDDESTATLMTAFYAAMWKDGLTAPEALWRAKQSLRTANAPVRAWAPFVFSGDPTPD